MSGVLELLRAAPMLAEVRAEDLRTSAPWWHARVLADGVTLWSAGEPGGGVAIVRSGELEARLHGWVVGTIGPHELVGEGTAFSPDNVRVASIVSRGTTELVELPAARMVDLRTQAPAVYDALLSDALRIAAARVTRTDSRIAALARGTTAAPERATGLAQLWQRMRGTFAGEPIPIGRSLRALPGLHNAPGAPLVRIGAAMMPRRLQAGEALFLEGDPGTSAFLLAEGSIGVFRTTADGRGEQLAEVHPASLVGTGALLSHSTRNASCVATSPCWVYEMTQDSYRQLSGEPLRLWREALMAALRYQLGVADRHLTCLAAEGAEALKKAAVGVVVYEAEATET